MGLGKSLSRVQLMGQGQGRILSKQLARDGEKLKIKCMSGFRRQEPAEHCDVTMVLFQISDRGAGGLIFVLDFGVSASKF